MPAKAPRRTAERILERALALFNRLGEPNVSIPTLAAALGMSAGNLHYHFPAKEGLVNTLFDRHALAMKPLLAQAGLARDIAGAWDHVQALLRTVRDARFLYRDRNDLVSRNRHLEAGMRQLVQDQVTAMAAIVSGLAQGGALRAEPGTAGPLAEAMAILLVSWLGFEYARDPRHALEDGAMEPVLARAAHRLLSLLVPYLDESQRRLLQDLARVRVAEAA